MVEIFTFRNGLVVEVEVIRSEGLPTSQPER